MEILSVTSALECTKLMKVGIFFEFDTLDSYPMHFWYNRMPGYLFIPGFQALYSSWISLQSRRNFLRILGEIDASARYSPHTQPALASLSRPFA